MTETPFIQPVATVRQAVKAIEKAKADDARTLMLGGLEISRRERDVVS